MSQPARLHKVEDNNVSPVEAWVQTHALLCLFVLFAFLTALFVVLMFALVGVSATESGAMRNFVNGGFV